MTNVSPDPSSPPSPSTVDYTQEIRFAVVMYGGSSLAIYMNGVAQEMLRLVRATAPDPDDASQSTPLIPDEKLSGSERVYRKLGKILSRGDSQDLSGDTPIRTRFVIDILSGTSAGGINAVFLAKALANSQDMSSLRNLWVTQGDVNVLLNDKQSDKDIKIGQQNPPRSLFNSRRMYYELLDALEGMDRNAAAQAGGKANANGKPPYTSPYVNELDLFTTATDIWGQIVSMRLADNVAIERRHLNKFHFSFNSTRNDFSRANNPFLAFASRYTSAHPAPFEPMKLSDIDEILEKHEDYKNLPNLRANDSRWRAFFEGYLQHTEDGSEIPGTVDRRKLRDHLAHKFEKRPFSDGGVLDNSPFSFAIDKLQFHHTKLPVDRKLLYIDPVPEHPEKEHAPEVQPNAIKNGWLSLSVLPRYQFIREDLERVLQRNRLIERVNGILKGVEQDEMERLRKQRENNLKKVTRQILEQAESGAHLSNESSKENEEDDPDIPLSSYQFGKKTLDEMIHRMGSSWGGYQRLRVAETTDELVKIFSSAAGFDEDSDEFVAIRHLVRVWRNQKYDPYGKKNPVTGEVPDSGHEDADKFSQNWFLFQYDLKWRLRRLKFVLTKIDEIACMDTRTDRIMAITAGGDEGAAEAFKASYAAAPTDAKTFRLHLQSLKQELSNAIKILNDARQALLSRVGDEEDVLANPLDKAIAAIGITRAELLNILRKRTEDDRDHAAKNLLKSKQKNFDDFLLILNGQLKTLMDDVSARVKGDKEYKGRGILEVSELPSSLQSAEERIHTTLRYYYENFDRYDMISYPILYATDVGEEMDTIEIFRISPEDAGFLIKDKTLRNKKLAGTSIGNFGAFFYEPFRTNDILWGRLDCADRLVTTLLSSAPPTSEIKKLRGELIREASRAIIAEELDTKDKAGLRSLLIAALKESDSGGAKKDFLSDLEKHLAERSPDLSKMQDFLTNCLKGTDPLDDFVATSSFKHQIPNETLVRTASRSARVFSRMLEGISEEQKYNRQPTVWFTRLTQLFWGLVEVAVPGSIGNLLFRHWLKLLYLFEFLLVSFGTLFLNRPVQQLGLLTFAITVIAHAATLFLGDWIIGKKKKEPDEFVPEARAITPPHGEDEKQVSLGRVLLRAIVIVPFVVCAIIGVIFLFAFFFAEKGVESPANTIWTYFEGWRTWLATDVPIGLNWRTLVRFSLPAVILILFIMTVWGDVRDFYTGLVKRQDEETDA